MLLGRSAFLGVCIAIMVSIALVPPPDNWKHWPASTGKLHSCLRPFVKDLGGFAVRWDETHLCVSHQHRPALAGALWSTVPGVPFVVAFDGHLEIRGEDGLYQVGDHRDHPTTVQTVDNVTLVGPAEADRGAAGGADASLVVSGRMWRDRQGRHRGHHGNACAAITAVEEAHSVYSSYRYNLTFTLVDANQLRFVLAWEGGRLNVAYDGLGADNQTISGMAAALEGLPSETQPHGLFDAPRHPGEGQLASLRYQSHKDESVFGLGEQFSFFNLKGLRVPIITSEQGIGRGAQPLTWFLNRWRHGLGGSWHSTYTSIPHYMTSAMRSLFLEGYEYCVFDFSHDEETTVEIDSPSRTLVGRLLHGNSPADLIFEYTKYSGRQKPLPAWTGRGAVVGLQGGTAELLRKYERLKGAGVPMAALWVQDWSGKRRTSLADRLWWNWEVDARHYPLWEELLCDLAADGVSMMTYVNPYLAQLPPEEKLHRKDLFSEALARGYLMRNASGGAYLLTSVTPEFIFGMVDLTNPEAEDWLARILERNVMGCHAPDDCSHHRCRKRRQAERAQGALHGRPHVPADGNTGEGGNVAHERLTDLRHFFEDSLHHAGKGGGANATDPKQAAALGGPRQHGANAHPPPLANTVGEQGSRDDDEAYGGVLGWMADFGEYLPFDAVLWSGESTSTAHNRFPEMWADINRRAVEAAGLRGTSVFFSRAGAHKSPAISPLFWLGDQLVSWDRHDGLQSVITAMTSAGLSGYSLMHSDVGGYTSIKRFPFRYLRSKELAMRWMEASAFADALFRSHEGTLPDDSCQVYSDEDLFLLGRDLLVVPVLKHGSTEVEAYLPAGGDSWEDVWTGQRFNTSEGTGLLVKRPAPLGHPAVFLRASNQALSPVLVNVLENVMSILREESNKPPPISLITADFCRPHE
eukprot:jgi/Mesvir1/21143/Mv14191-RA.2